MKIIEVKKAIRDTYKQYKKGNISKQEYLDEVQSLRWQFPQYFYPAEWRI